MKKKLFLTAVLIALLTNAFNAQTNFNFESLIIPLSTGYWNGSDESGSFGNTEITFPNDFNTEYQSWSGFSFAYDTITSDKQYSAHTVSTSGHVFGIGFVPSDWQGGTYDNIPIVCKFTHPVQITSVDITNSEYAADVILNGSSFGEPAFSSGDYFKLIINAYHNNQNVGNINFFLADYTNGNSIVIDTWEEINLSSFGTVDSISFNLESTHNGDYGMNTPAYFCLDNLTYTNTLSTENNIKKSFSLYPNPAKDIVTIETNENSSISVFDLSGKKVFEKTNCSGFEQINISNLISGIYSVQITNIDEVFTKKLIVK
jgi:hypothetical protein